MLNKVEVESYRNHKYAPQVILISEVGVNPTFLIDRTAINWSKSE